MTFIKLSGLIAAAALAVAGCAPTTQVTQAPAAAPPPPMRMLGLESVVGKTAAALEAQFGRPDLDVREGIARKLQYSGPACVLDAYLYPPTAGAAPVVTYVDARMLDGRDMDRASCIAALHQQAK
jgi:hypothetical protein